MADTLISGIFVTVIYGKRDIWSKNSKVRDIETPLMGPHLARWIKVVSVNRINNCCPSYATKALHLASWPNTPHTVQNQTTTNGNTLQTSNRERISSRIQVLCDDLVLFRLRLKKAQSSLHWDCIFFLPNAMEEKTSEFQENLNTSNRTKAAKTEGKNGLASFCAQWTRKRGSKPLQKLSGAANLQSKNLDFWRLRNKIRMRSLSHLENAIKTYKLFHFILNFYLKLKRVSNRRSQISSAVPYI